MGCGQMDHLYINIKIYIHMYVCVKSNGAARVITANHKF